MTAAQNAREDGEAFSSSWILRSKSIQDLNVPSEYYIGESRGQLHQLDVSWAPGDPLAITITALQIASINSSMITTRPCSTGIAAGSCFAGVEAVQSRIAGSEALYDQCIAFCLSRHTNQSTPSGPMADIVFARIEKEQLRLAQSQIKRHKNSEAHTNWLALQLLHSKGRACSSRWFSCERPEDSVPCHLSDGRLAWVPKVALNGDIVVVFRGGPRPFLVREMTDGAYRIVGDMEIPGLTFDMIMASDWSQAKEYRIM
jgi:hypothetical protein